MDYAAPALFALFTWWFATGIILWLDGLPARTHRWTLLGSTLILIGSAAALYHLRGNTDVVSVYLSFLAVLGIWAWNETTFLLGVLTGPVQRPCPEGARGMERFRAAVDSVLYHEAGLILSGVAIAIITWGDSQHFGPFSARAIALSGHLFPRASCQWIVRLDRHAGDNRRCSFVRRRGPYA
jgi:putative photosynthetic complex assembly protein 2